jgi:hypothetical protein
MVVPAVVLSLGIIDIFDIYLLQIHSKAYKSGMILQFYLFSYFVYFTYATMVEAVADSYFQLAGSFLVVR